MKIQIPVLLLFILAANLFAQSRKDKLDKYLLLLEDNNKAMLSVAILEDGKLFYQKATGFSSVADKSKSTVQTEYRIGSITKMFTSSIIFQLIEEGKLTLDTRLAKFYPQIANADKITIGEMLSHRSGIYSFTDDKKYMQYYTSPKTHAEILEMISSYKPVFEPGEKYAYSNSNYVLLGYIIEKITGSSYAEELEKRITSKLKLDDTYYGGKIGARSNEAHSYRFQDDAWQLQPETDMSIPHAAGAIVSTPYDMAVFISSLFNNKVVSDKSLQQMTRIRDGYGMGMMQFPFYKRKAYGHNGGIDGFISNVAYFPDEKVALAITCNGLNYNFNDILIGVLSIYFDMPYDLPDFSSQPVALKAEDLAKYQGVYSSSALPLKITIMLKDGKLFAQATGQNAFPLTSFSPSEFHFDPAGIIMKFNTDSKGMVQYNSFILNQGGGKFPYTRESGNN